MEDVPRRFKRYGAQIEQRLTKELPHFQEEVKQAEGETIPEQVINYVKRYDPTPQGTYTEWLITRWLSNTYSLEDLGGISENLRVFNNKRAQIEIKDILKYKTPIDLAAAVRQFIKVDGAVPEYFQGREAEMASPRHTDILLDNAEFLVVHPKDKESAQYYGYHTGTNGQPWCIAWGIPKTEMRNHANQFEGYTSNDRPFILIFDKRGHASFRDGPAYAVRLHKNGPMLTLKENGSEIDAMPYLTDTLAPAITGRVADMLCARYPWTSADFWASATDSDVVRMVGEKPMRFLPLAIQHGRASEALQMAVVKQKYYNMKYIKNPSEAVQMAAVKQNGLAIQFINNPSEAVQMAAVQQNGHAIQYINNPSEAVQMAAVQRNGEAIYYIKNPSEAVQMAAVQQNGIAIRDIKNPSEAVQMAAVQQNGHAIRYVNNPSDAVQMAAVQQNGAAIPFLRSPSEAVQMAAVQQNGNAIYYIKNPSEAVQMAAVQQNGYAIQFIKNPSEAVQMAAVLNWSLFIEYIENPSEEVQMAAVQRNGLAIRYVNNPSEAVQMAAVRQDSWAIRYIKDPSEAVRRRAALP
jgi:hypothetical protein